MKKVLILAHKPQVDCEKSAKLCFEDESFESLVFQSELRLKEEVKRDNHLFIGCIIEKGLTISRDTEELLLRKNDKCQLFRRVSI